MTVINVPIESTEQWLQARRANINASEIAAASGAHEFLTRYGLIARKLGRLEDVSDSTVLRRGRLLEPVARQMLAEQCQDWTQVSAGSYYYDPIERIGCTPDLFVKNERGIGVVELKSVEASVFARKWHAETGELEPPLWIAIQAMMQQYLTGAEFAYVAALVIGYGLSLEVIEVKYRADVINQVRADAAACWQLIDAGQLPDPDFEADRGNLAKVLRQDDGSELDLTGDNEMPQIAAQLSAARDAKSIAEESIEHCQAKILHKIGHAQKAIFAGGVITAKTVHRKGYVAQPSTYRRLNVRPTRERAEA
jgi:predicted phage-related endonuclease